jgi:hypothetical protein
MNIPRSAPTGLGDLVEDLLILLKSRYGLVFLSTSEDERAELLLRHLADRLNISFYRWNRTRGLRLQDSAAPIGKDETLTQSLGRIARISSGVAHFRLVSADLEDVHVVDSLREVALHFSRRRGAVVVTSPELQVPAELSSHVARLELPPPTKRDFRDLLEGLIEELSRRMPIDVDLSSEDRARILVNLQGLTLLEAEKILTRAIIEDGRLDRDDLLNVVTAKREVVEREGLLEFYPPSKNGVEIAGLDTLKQWLRERREVVVTPESAERFGLEFPRGILLLGVPGCGKSLCAKSVATEWGLPLLRFDPSRLYSKYIGDSEKNFQRAIATAEKVAPVILWIDELEKAFSSASGSEDGGTSQRIFGSFLSWLQERTSPIFVVATANQVDKLPAEFLRKGRFDEIFFVDLPSAAVREEIFRIHLARRERDPQNFEVRVLAQASAGFSGAEIEQVVLSSLFAAFSQGQEISTALLMDEIRATQPLSHAMPEHIAQLRSWVGTRFRSAH